MLRWTDPWTSCNFYTLQFLSSWWWAVCRPKLVEQLRNVRIINSTTRLHLVGSFNEIYITMHGSMNIMQFLYITVFELLMMSGVSHETCWAIKKHKNNKFYYTAASCWFFLWDLCYDARIHEHQTFKVLLKINCLMRFCELTAVYLSYETLKCILFTKFSVFDVKEYGIRHSCAFWICSNCRLNEQKTRFSSFVWADFCRGSEFIIIRGDTVFDFFMCMP